MRELIDVKVTLSEKQLKKLAKGKVVQLAHKHLNGSQALKVGHETYKKLIKAKKSGKGVRIMLEPDELEGSGIFKAFKKSAKRLAKQAAKGGVKMGKTLYKHRKEIKSGLVAAKQIYDLYSELKGSGFSDDEIRGMGYGHLIRDTKRVIKRVAPVVKAAVKFADGGDVAPNKLTKQAKKKKKPVPKGKQAKQDFVGKVLALRDSGYSNQDIEELYTDGGGLFGDIGKLIGKRVISHIPIVSDAVAAVELGLDVAKLATRSTSGVVERPSVLQHEIHSLKSRRT